VLGGLGVAAAVGLAGCTGGGGSDSNGAESGDDSGMTNTATDSGSGSMGGSDRFEYTFGSNDDVSGSSLTGIRANYPDGSGAVRGAEVASVTLAGSDVSDDLDSTSTSNDGSTLTADFGGSYDVAPDDTLTMELSGVSAPDGAYAVEVVVNPQSGGTSFETSF
jgi:hypothetical protein